MRIELKSAKIWIATDVTDFRKGVNGLTEIIKNSFNQLSEDAIYVFYNRAKNKLKLLARHRNGFILIYKRLDKNHFTLKANELNTYEVSEQQLSWLLAGLNWVDMSDWKELAYQDYY